MFLEATSYASTGKCYAYAGHIRDQNSQICRVPKTPPISASPLWMYPKALAAPPVSHGPLAKDPLCFANL